jgi:hypothetical protein
LIGINSARFNVAAGGIAGGLGGDDSSNRAEEQDGSAHLEDLSLELACERKVWRKGRVLLLLSGGVSLVFEARCKSSNKLISTGGCGLSYEREAVMKRYLEQMN